MVLINVLLRAILVSLVRTYENNKPNIISGYMVCSYPTIKNVFIMTGDVLPHV